MYFVSELDTPLPDPDCSPMHLFEMTTSTTPQALDADNSILKTDGLSKTDHTTFIVYNYYLVAINKMTS